MGSNTEFMSMGSIYDTYGPQGIQTLDVVWRGGKLEARYTDDTQMAELVLTGMMYARDLGKNLDDAMNDLARDFIEWSHNPQGGHRAPGGSCLGGCRRLESGVPWREGGNPTAGGCGSVMRAWPVGLIWHDDIQRCEEWGVAQSQLTHNAPLAIAASASCAVGTAMLFNGADVDVVVSEMVRIADKYDHITSQMIARAAKEAVEGVDPKPVFERLQSWAGHEAIAASVFILLRHPNDVKAAILEGANTPGDSDSIATIAGAMVGARVGLYGLPAEWVRDVERGAELILLSDQVSEVIQNAYTPSDEGFDHISDEDPTEETP
jgi:ADP-ribosylglycohydrolase